MHIEVPHRPVTGGVFGVGDCHGMPQPLVACPLRWWLGCVPLRHIWQRLPGLPRRQQVPQGLAVLVLERQGTEVVYPVAADKYFGPLPSPLRGVNQRGINARIGFSEPRTALVASSWTHLPRVIPR